MRSAPGSRQRPAGMADVLMAIAVGAGLASSGACRGVREARAPSSGPAPALGGRPEAVFQYASPSLRSTFRRSPDPSAQAGRFLVAVTLGTGEQSRVRPIAADPGDPGKVPAGTFSVAVMAGNPWP